MNFKQWLQSKPAIIDRAILARAIHNLINATSDMVKNSRLQPYESGKFLVPDENDFMKVFNLNREDYEALKKAEIVVMNSFGGTYFYTNKLQEVVQELKNTGNFV